MGTPSTDIPAAFLPASHPAAAGAVAAAMAAGEDRLPDPPEFPCDLIPLPGGLILDEGLDNERVVSTVRVRELNGEDEEALARALASGEPYHFLTTLLERGTVQVGDEPEASTRALLGRLLIGDRDAVLIGIRVATYGNSIKVFNFRCPECGNISDIEFELDDDIEVRKLDNPHDNVFEVTLRNGSVAKVRLPDGNTQVALNEGKPTQARRNTIIIQKCVESITTPDGRERRMIVSPRMALSLGMADRRTILSEITDRQPGPKYTDIKITDMDCGKEVSLAVDLGDLFLA